MSTAPTTSSPTPPNDPEYILGTGRAELERLQLQHRLWSDAAHALWRRAAIRPGHKVLDVGCGPGFAALDLAAIVGAGTDERGEQGFVVGVDESGRFLDHLNHAAHTLGVVNLCGAVGDVCELHKVKGLPPGSFDAAYARWVLCFVPRPEDAVHGVANLLKRGGVFMIQDYFNYEAMCTAPRSPAFAKAVAATGRSWRSRGGDPDIVGRLPAMLEAAGFTVTHLGVHQRLARPGETMWSWPTTFWNSFLPTLVAAGFLTEGDREQWRREWDELERTPGAFCTLPAVYDLIAVKR
jgi:ubiquinone/menaquinone biosynthesis C-methylase UbiE